MFDFNTLVYLMLIGGGIPTLLVAIVAFRFGMLLTKLVFISSLCVSSGNVARDLLVLYESLNWFIFVDPSLIFRVLCVDPTGLIYCYSKYSASNWFSLHLVVQQSCCRSYREF